MGHDPHLDHPGEMTWFVGHGPAPILGDCPHVDCRHHATSVVGHGPDYEHYELVVCDVDDQCDGGCRGWQADYPPADVPAGLPARRLHNFRQFDPDREHHTTREEHRAEADRIAAERMAARRAQLVSEARA